MRYVQTMIGVVLVTMLLIGCSSEEAAPGDIGTSATGDVGATATGDAPDRAVTHAESSADFGGEEAWVAELIETQPTWAATTEHPVFTPAYQATLCRQLRVTGDLGPHGQHAYWVYTNPAANDAFLAFDAVPAGGIIIKQKHVDWEDAEGHREPVALGVMIKHEAGYAPDHGDWEYGYITLDEEGQVVEATRGQIATCIDCHANQTETDYLFRGYLNQQADSADFDDLFLSVERDDEPAFRPPLLERND